MHFRLWYDFTISPCNDENFRADQSRARWKRIYRTLWQRRTCPLIVQGLGTDDMTGRYRCAFKNVGFCLFWREVAALSLSDEDEFSLKQ